MEKITIYYDAGKARTSWRQSRHDGHKAAMMVAKPP
jgi:hypothetical protein